MKKNENITRTAVLVNLSACKGQARKRWQSIRQEVLRRIPEDSLIIPFEGKIDLDTLLPRLMLEDKVNCFISAGGDGSVHYLLNALLEQKTIRPQDVYIGAIGLGSSNDFQKPYSEKIEGIPVRIKLDGARLADVGRVDYLKPDGKSAHRFFIINASLGVTAEANRLFNEEDAFLRHLKKYGTSLAILYTAIKTILRFRNFEVRMQVGKQLEKVTLSNLAVIKNPHVSGNMVYDQPIGMADGQLGLNYCLDMNKRELIKAVSDLEKGRFMGPPKRYSRFVKSLQIDVDQPVPMETDGEVFPGTQFRFSILPRHINLLTHEH